MSSVTPDSHSSSRSRVAIGARMVLVVLSVALSGAIGAALWALALAGPSAEQSGTHASAATHSLGPDVDPEFAGREVRRRLAWIDRAGRVTPIDAPVRGYVYPRVSPDGRWVAVDIRDARRGVWSWDDERRSLAPLGRGRDGDLSPLWTRSGDAVVFARTRGAAPGLYRLGVRPPGLAVRLPGESPSLLMPSAIATDDRHLVVTTSVASGFDVVMVDLEGDGTSQPLVTSAEDDLNAEVSPDGRWLAYQSRRGGQFDIWVTPLRLGDGRAGEDREGGAAGVLAVGQRMTTGGGTRPAWTRGGRELVYLTHDGEMMALSVASAPGGDVPAPGGGYSGGVVASAPRLLFVADIYRELVGRTFDVTADGERFLVVLEAR